MTTDESNAASGGPLMAGPSTGGQFKKRRPMADRVSVKSLFERQPPHSLEAEMSLLGSLILDPNIVADILGIVSSATDFYKEAHGHIFRAIIDVYDQRHSGDLIQFTDMLRDRHVLDEVGGQNYLLELANAVPTSVNAPHFARIVAEKAKLRRLIDAAGQILYDAYHTGDLGPDGAREVLDKAEMSIFEIAQEVGNNDPQSLSELLTIEMQRIDSPEFERDVSGVRSGYSDMDDLLRGFQPGELIILAARPSMGKTALVLNLAEQIAVGGMVGGQAKPVAPIGLFSLEMSKNAIVQRLLSARSGVSSQALRGGTSISDSDLRRLNAAAGDLSAASVYVDDTPNLTVLNLRARARRMVAQHGVKILMIDYLQLMTAPGAARESRQVEVSAISRGIKALARELKVPVICLSQLNRASESREGNRPRMSDLRESGSIEQDADVIMLLHREDYYHVQDEDWKSENPDKIGIAEVIIAKQRNGPTGVVKLVWDSNTTRFRSFDAHAQPNSGYRSPSAAAMDFGAPQVKSSRPWTSGGAAGVPAEDAPFASGGSGQPGGSSFGGRSRTGPINSHRDGGGPDRGSLPTPIDDDLGDIPA